jgi:hypothetical protein
MGVSLACSMFQFLSFYQREMALFTAHNLDRKAADFCLDSELTPLFKVCGKLWRPRQAHLVLCVCVLRCVLMCIKAANYRVLTRRQLTSASTQS